MPIPRRRASLPMLAVTSGGLGYLRPAPGTWGSLPPPIVVLVLILLGSPTWLITLIMAIGVIGCTGFCVLYGDAAEAAFRRKDPSSVVADETAGQCLALIAFPAAHPHGPWLLLVAFLGFRLFDILKPPPARGLQRVAGGWGIVLDDLIAGAMALALVQLLAVTIS